MRKIKKRQTAIVVVPIVLFILLAIAIQSEFISGFENWTYSEIVEHMSPTLTRVLKIITHLGDPISVIVICLILLALPHFRKTYSLLISINVILQVFINYSLKLLFARERPDILQLVTEKSYSFPSGHAMINMGLYLMLSICIYKTVKSKKLKYVFICILMIFPIIIGLTRVYLGVHYITDILAGWSLGIAITFVVYKIFDKKNVLEEKKDIKMDS